MMTLHTDLQHRSGGTCELCNAQTAEHAYTVSPKDETTENQVVLCQTCLHEIDHPTEPGHWRCLEGSIWNPEPAVQALSYRLLYGLRDYGWATDVLHSLDLEEHIVQWAMSAYETAPVHVDASVMNYKMGIQSF